MWKIIHIWLNTEIIDLALMITLMRSDEGCKRECKIVLPPSPQCVTSYTGINKVWKNVDKVIISSTYICLRPQVKGIKNKKNSEITQITVAGS